MKLLCSDLDRTLLPNGDHAESPLARPILWQLLRTYAVLLAYVSGRDLYRVEQAIHDYDLPLPNVIVADVGTSVYLRQDGQWKKSDQWESVIAADWKGLDTEAVKALLHEVTDLQHQEADRQASFKRSYYLSDSIDQVQLRNSVEQRLRADGIKASLVFSNDPQRNLGLLDILPARASKRDAVNFIKSLLRLEGKDVLFAGDSGNDVSAIAGPTPGVLVANASGHTRASVRDAMLANGTHGTTFFARGDVAVESAEPLNGNYAAGIVEGLMHFRPDYRHHLGDLDWLELAQSVTTVSREPLIYPIARSVIADRAGFQE